MKVGSSSIQLERVMAALAPYLRDDLTPEARRMAAEAALAAVPEQAEATPYRDSAMIAATYGIIRPAPKNKAE